MTQRSFQTGLVVLLSALVVTTPSVGASSGDTGHASIATESLHVPDSIDSWILGYGVDAPCEAVSFCQTCISTCTAVCLQNGGQPLSTCRITDDDCTCICECKRPTVSIQAF